MDRPTSIGDVFDAPQTTSGAFLTVREVSAHFGGVRGLNGVSFEVGSHDVVAVIGPNGAGKTTLLNAISQLIRISGDVMLDGQRLTGVAPSKVAKLGVARSFQDPYLIEHYTILENMLCGAHRRMPYSPADQVIRRGKVKRLESQMQDRAEQLLAFLGLADVATEAAGSLPYGTRKLVDIARAMVSGPRLLLLDEPSSGLDAADRGRLTRVLTALRREQQVAVVVVEHHMDVVRQIASQVVALMAGTVLMTGDPADVLDSPVFREALVGSSAGPPAGDPPKG